jgi:hypothetical protein
MIWDLQAWGPSFKDKHFHRSRTKYYRSRRGKIAYLIPFPINIHVSHNLKTYNETKIKFLLIATIATSAVALGPASLARPTMSRLSMSAEGLADET